MLGPGQEKEDLKINTDPPRGLELELQSSSQDTPPWCPMEPAGDRGRGGEGRDQRRCPDEVTASGGQRLVSFRGFIC